MNITINKNNPRAVKARYYLLFKGKNIKTALAFIGAVTLLLAVASIVLGQWFGWLLVIIPIVLLMLHEWYRHDIALISPNQNSVEPIDILDPEVLGRLKSNDIDNKTLLEVLKKTNGFWFIANRLLIPIDIIDPEESGDWWNMALSLWQQHPTKEGITAAHILVAMVLNSSQKNTYLSYSRCSEDDVLQGLKWFTYFGELRSSITTRKDSGGIARDWAVGYTPLLDTYAHNISRSIQYGGVAHREIVGHKNVVNQMSSIFTSNGRANVALVGEVGSGKSTCIYAFGEKLLFDTSLKSVQYNQIYQVDIASLLTRVAADKIDYVLQHLCGEAYAAKNILLYFENAGSFFGFDNGPDVTNSILPIIEGGKVRMIFSFTTLQWQYLQKTKSQVVAALNYQAVLPTNEHDTLRVLENQALFTEAQYNCVFTYESLKEVYKLADRYGPEISMPGRAISVLEDVARNSQGGLVQKTDVQKTIEQTTGVKVATADTSEKDVLLRLEGQLKERVIGQDVAIKELVSALKRSRTGVANPNKPIGTFLFLGPTGVGKTEMSKTLANVYFGGKTGLIRVDMNEYITQDSIHKLLQASSEYGTAFLESIRKQPFSVVLFDEIEKAHPDIINTLLQLLDEGTIKDSDNRDVSFKDAIVIATSNAGAQEIREHITSGAPLEQLEKQLADMLISKGIFKPELVNRFDDVIIFTPLSQDSLRSVVKVMLGDINTQLIAQGVQVSLTDDAIEWLATQGYDERLGARPLRRMMQKTVETAVSNVMLEQTVDHGAVITLSATQLQTTQ